MTVQRLTGNDLGALKIFIGMEVAGRQGEPQPDEEKEEIGPSPHFPWAKIVATLCLSLQDRSFRIPLSFRAALEEMA